MKNYHIHIKGQVQGVGFRPFVYKMVTSKNLNGYVKNTSEGVYIEVETSDPIEIIVDEIREKKPPLAQIDHIQFYEVPLKEYTEFTIIHSNESSKTEINLTPDYTVCELCKNELLQVNDRRYLYPFITCTNCGPRYSILHKIPYDRPFTTMSSFVQCPECLKEYEDPLNRRYYSQTNSCPTCAVSLQLIDSKTQKEIRVSQNELIEYSVDRINQNAIIAIKGIGGYLLVGKATNEKVVAEIRKRKNRPAKPLALLMRDLKMVEGYVELTKKSKRELTKNTSPIVLLKKKKNELPKNIAFDNDYLGIMLPYTPLLYLIMNLIDFPLIATSANLTSSPIIYNKEQSSYSHLYQIADYIMSNNREIITPQDDSVVGFTSHSNKKIIYRRSRGLSPSLIEVNKPKGDNIILSLGADLKNTFGLWNGSSLVLSQYFGNMGSYDTQNEVIKAQNHILGIYKVKPQLVLIDKNDQFFSSQQASIYGKASIVKIQHHKAHFAAVLGDCKLFPLKTTILGVVWDGIGLGDDKAIWGGEFFMANNKEMKRIDHLKYSVYFLNDKMAKEPRLSAFSFLKRKEKIQNKFTEIEYVIYNKKIREEKLKTSSIGRLFDAVSSLLELTDYNQYEGYAASLLEKEATSFFNRNKGYKDHYSSSVLDGEELCELILEEYIKGVDRQEIAFKFHLTLIEWVRIVAKNHRLTKIAFSGGVFQNRLLIDLIDKELKEYEVFFHEKLPPNDENIAYGQLIYQSFFS